MAALEEADLVLRLLSSLPVSERQPSIDSLGPDLEKRDADINYSSKEEQGYPSCCGQSLRGSTGSLPGVFTCGSSPAGIVQDLGCASSQQNACQGDLMTLTGLHYIICDLL